MIQSFSKVVCRAQEVVIRFENQGDTTEHLEDLKKENEKQINRLKEDLDKLTSEFEEMKYSGEAKLSRFHSLSKLSLLEGFSLIVEVLWFF